MHDSGKRVFNQTAILFANSNVLRQPFCFVISKQQCKYMKTENSGDTASRHMEINKTDYAKQHLYISNI